MTELTITRPDDWHVHLRDGDALQHTCADMARYFQRAIVMPNLTPPVTTVDAALAYRDRILTAMAKQPRQFDPLMRKDMRDVARPDQAAPCHQKLCHITAPICQGTNS